MARRPNYAGIDVSDPTSLNIATVTWDWIRRLRDTVKMKIVLKGILTREDEGELSCKLFLSCLIPIFAALAMRLLIKQSLVHPDLTRRDREHLFRAIATIHDKTGYRLSSGSSPLLRARSGVKFEGRARCVLFMFSGHIGQFLDCVAGESR
jgi:hypothetical protein